MQTALMGGVGASGVGGEQSGHGLDALAGKLGKKTHPISGKAGGLATVPKLGADVGEKLLQASPGIVRGRFHTARRRVAGRAYREV